MAWVVEMTGVDPADGQVKRHLFAQGEGLALDDDIYVNPGLVSWASPSQKIDVGKAGMVEQNADAGELILSNSPPSIDEPGPWDTLLDLAWYGRRVSLFSVGTVWANRVLVAWGVMEQPYGNLIGGSSADANLRFTLRDPRAPLDAPLQPIKFIGDNVGPVGVEGISDLKGKPKPILYGSASNLPVPRVNESLLIYMVADAAVSVLCVRDGGVSLATGVGRANLASLQANIPAGGSYDYCSTATGTYIRLGTTPVYNITVDASEGASAADRSHAKIWSRLRTQRCSSATSGAVNAASVAAAHAASPDEAGFWWSGEITQLAALDEVLSGFGGFEVQNAAEEWVVRQLVLPAGAPVLEFLKLSPIVSLKANSRYLATIQRVRPSYAPNGVPPYRVTVRWGRNYSTMSESDFAGSAAKRLRDKFADEWRLETATNPATWDPVAKTGLFSNAPELTVETGFTPGADGVTCPPAVAEASRLKTMLCVLRDQYQISFIPEVGDVILPGDEVSILYAGMGLSAGPHFRVLQSGFILGSSGPEMDLVVGLRL